MSEYWWLLKYVSIKDEIDIMCQSAGVPIYVGILIEIAVSKYQQNDRYFVSVRRSAYLCRNVDSYIEVCNYQRNVCYCVSVSNSAHLCRDIDSYWAFILNPRILKSRRWIEECLISRFQVCIHSLFMNDWEIGAVVPLEIEIRLKIDHFSTECLFCWRLFKFLFIVHFLGRRRLFSDN